MYKIEIEWGFRSPALSILTGEVKIGNIDMGRLPQDITSFQVKKERGYLGYTNCPAIFGRCKPLVDIITNAYFDGMLMSNESIEWFRNASKKNNEVFVTLLD